MTSYKENITEHYLQPNNDKTLFCSYLYLQVIFNFVFTKNNVLVALGGLLMTSSDQKVKATISVKVTEGQQNQFIPLCSIWLFTSGIMKLICKKGRSMIHLSMNSRHLKVMNKLCIQSIIKRLW